MRQANVRQLHTMKSTIVTINDKKVEVKKLPLGKYAEVLEALDKLPQKLSGLDKISEDKIISILPKLLSDSFPELIKIISVASDVPEKELTEEYGLDDVTTLLKAIFEVNNFNLVKKNLQDTFSKKQEKVQDTGSKT